MAAANPDEITAKLVKLKLGESFLEKACDSVDEVFGPQWRDETKPRPYEWRAPSGSEKLGDEAEEMVMRALGRRQFCELLGEPVYIISGENFIYFLQNNPGREYCFFKSEAERSSSRWIIGENDIIFMTRKLGIVNIEIKGKQ